MLRISRAHLQALCYLESGGASGVFNCGYGRGSSVREVLRMVEEASGSKLRVEEGPRRPGDAAELVADVSRIKAVLGWRPQRDGLDVICASALAWEKKLGAR